MNTYNKYKREYYQKHRDELKIKNKIWRNNHIKNGLCIACNNPISTNSKCLCDYHLIKNRHFYSQTDQKRHVIFATEDEYIKVKKFLADLRASQ